MEVGVDFKDMGGISACCSAFQGFLAFGLRSEYCCFELRVVLGQVKDIRDRHALNLQLRIEL